MVVLFLVMRGTNRYYARVDEEISADDEPGGPTAPARVHAVVLVARLHKPALRALALARATHPDDLDAVTLDVEPDATRALLAEWERRGIATPLHVVEAPYRDLVRPFVAHVRRLRREQPRTVITVFIPEYVVTRWWQQLLHNQSALRLKARLLFTPGVVVVDVPYQLGSGDQGWLGRRPPSAGADTAGTTSADTPDRVPVVPPR